MSIRLTGAATVRAGDHLNLLQLPASPCTLTRWWDFSPVAVPHMRTQGQGEVEGSGGAGDGALATAGGEVVGLDQLAAGGLPPGGGMGEPAAARWSRQAGE